MRHFFITIFLTISICGWIQGQIASVTTHESRCTNSGSITVSIANFAAGSVATYTLKSSTGVVLESVASNANPFTFSNVAAENYTVEATYNGQTYTSPATVVGNYTFPQVTGTVFQNTITANVTNGRPPFSYRISTNLTGPWSAWQTSPVFDSLCPGVYYIGMVDSCHVPVASSGSFVNLPLQISQTVIDHPTGLDTVIVHTNTYCTNYSLTNHATTITQSNPIFSMVLDSCYHTVSATNVCNQTATTGFGNQTPPPQASLICVNFTNHSFTVAASNGVSPYTYTLLDANGTPISPLVSNNTGIFNNVLPLINNGNPYYKVQVKDYCERTVMQNGLPYLVFYKNIYSLSGNCNNSNYYTLSNYYNASNTYPTVLSDVDTNNYVFTCLSCTPQQVWHSSTPNIGVNGFTPGAYSFQIVNQCGDTSLANITIPPASNGAYQTYLCDTHPNCNLTQIIPMGIAIDTFVLYETSNLTIPIASNTSGFFSNLTSGTSYTVVGIYTPYNNPCILPPPPYTFIQPPNQFPFTVSANSVILKNANCVQSNLKLLQVKIHPVNINVWYCNSYQIGMGSAIDTTTFSIIDPSNGLSYNEYCREHLSNDDYLLYFLVPNDYYYYSTTYEIIDNETLCSTTFTSYNLQAMPRNMIPILKCNGDVCYDYDPNIWGSNFTWGQDNWWNWTNGYRTWNAMWQITNDGFMYSYQNLNNSPPPPNVCQYNPISVLYGSFDIAQPYIYEVYDAHNNLLTTFNGGQVFNAPFSCVNSQTDSILLVRRYNFAIEQWLGLVPYNTQCIEESTWYVRPIPQTPIAAVGNIYVCGNTTTDATIHITGNTGPPYNISLVQLISPNNINVIGPYTAYSPDFTFSGLTLGHYVVITTDDCRGSDKRFSIINNCPGYCDPAAIQASFSHQEFCNTVTFTNQSLGDTFNYVHYWKFGDGAISDLKNPTHTYSTAGTYTVELIIQNILTGCKDTLSTPITLIPQTINISGVNALCSGFCADLSVNGGSTVSYLWSNAQTTSTIHVCPTSTSIYSVTYTDGICPHLGAATVTVNPVPILTVSSNSPVCVGGSIQLNATGASSYTWSGPAGYIATGSNPDRDNADTTHNGVYTVSATDSLGCSATGSTTVDVIVCPEICGNGFDDDNDGLTDAADPDCSCGN